MQATNQQMQMASTGWKSKAWILPYSLRRKAALLAHFRLLTSRNATE